jgi:hypothetical protein
MKPGMILPNPTNGDLEETVIACVSNASGVDACRISLETDLTLGLGIGGDDGADLIAAVREATGAQLSDYDFYPHFGPEAALTYHKPRSLTVRQLLQLIRGDLGIP